MSSSSTSSGPGSGTALVTLTARVLARDFHLSWLGPQVGRWAPTRAPWTTRWDRTARVRAPHRTVHAGPPVAGGRLSDMMPAPATGDADPTSFTSTRAGS